MASRDERIETYYHQSAWELAESLVDAEDALKELNDEACRLADHTDATCVVLAERNRYKAAWRSARRRAKRNRSYADSDLRFTRNMWSDAVRDLNRYRSAWLSARRRAADEANMGLEAVDHIRKDRDRWRSGHETAEAQLVWERRENARLRAFADEVKQVHGRCRDGEPDCAERFLRDVYDSMYELWAAEREKRQFVDRVQRRAARREFDDVAEDESRETTDAPRLECVGTEEDGGTVWRLATGRQIR
jgi:hypothetical protein